MQSRSRAAATRTGAIVLAALALLTAMPAPSAVALRLAIPDARAKAHVFAANTCAHDRHCVRHGVLNCRRDRRRVVFCRIFDERHTAVQGRYRCHRLIRLSLKPATHRIPVTGIGRWHCPG